MIRFIIAAWMQGAAAGASAQAEAAAPSPTPPPVWSGSAQVSFLQTTGNTDTSVYGLGAEVKYKGASPWSALAKGALNRGSVGGERNLKNLGVSLRASRALDERMDVFAEGAYFEDFYAGIDERETFELGLSRKLTGSEPHLFLLEVGFGLAREVRLPDFDSRDFGFGRGGLTYKWIISKTAEFQNQAIYTANLKDGPDWRFANLAALTATLRTRFSLKLSHGINHLHRPPLGKKKTDTVTAAALVAKF